MKKIQIHKIMQAIGRHRIHASISYNNNIKIIYDLSKAPHPANNVLNQPI